MMGLTKAELKQLVAGELLQRSESRVSVSKLYERLYPQYTLSPFHYKVCSALDEWREGKVRRVIINMPPGHLKSYLASQLTPAAYVGNHPDKQIIAGSYNTELAKKFGREVRNIIANSDYHTVFPKVFLRKDSKAATRWNINVDDGHGALEDKGGSYISAAVNKPVTGFRANRLLIDDPHANFDEGNNRRITDQVWEWFKELYTRKMPDMGVAIVMQRMSRHDLTARILEYAAAKKERWAQINFPAIRDGKTGEPIHYDGTREGLAKLSRGVALWPTFFTMEELLDSASILGPAQFNAMYQQIPDDTSGSIILDAWIRHWSDRATRAEGRIELPKDFDVVIQSWDLRFKGDSKNDPRTSYVVGQVWGFKGPDAFLLDQARGQWGFDDSISAVLAVSSRWPQARLKLIEDKANGPAAETQLRKRLSGLRLIAPGTNDKEARLFACQPEFRAGNIHFPPPETHDWAMGLVRRLVNFPAKPNDEGDAISQALNWRYSHTQKLKRLGE